MSQQLINALDAPGYKSTIRFTIPEFDYFAELLHDRLHAIFYHYEEWDSRFMLITNLYDRDPDRIQQRRINTPEDIEALIYCGMERQRFILEKDAPEELLKKTPNWDKVAWQEDRDKSWERLSGAIFERDMENVETFPYFDSFRKGELKFEDVKIGTLKAYFSENPNDFKKNERPIYSDYFDIEEDIYIGIPLLGMGLFQGIVWILCKKETQDRFDARTIKRIIKYFQVEYENLVLDWDVKGTNIKKTSLVGDVFSELEENNDIQKVIKIRRYYTNSEHYHRERIEQSDDVVQQMRKQYAKTAIINTLLDSYAHNISAHSLTALSWWFRERAEFLDESHGGRRVIEQMGRDTNPLIVHYLKTKALAKESDKERMALSRDLAPLFKFLQEKGAFWSGITRQTNTTGKISSLYSILWYDFVNNPLYLGTIANTEQVRKLHLNITIFDREEDQVGKIFRNTKYIKKSGDGILLDGTFATINLVDFDLTNHDPKSSVFVEKGEMYDLLADELREFKAFFPGGVVGKHSFFTLLENEIRNVKHFRGDRLEAIQRDGLILNLSIHTRPVDSTVDSKSKTDEILKIGVWLKHSVDVQADLLLRRIENLDKDILEEETMQPRLGGNQQDKLCASMLLTKTFDKVQDKDSPLGDIYFPWLKTVKADDYGDHVIEFEVSRRKYEQTSKEDFEDAFEEVKGEGYFKKYFHLWRADDIVSLDSKVELQDPQLENPNRFRFLYLSDKALPQKSELQQQGIIRVLEGEKAPVTVIDAYRQWLPKWLKTKEKDVVVDFFVNDTSNNGARISMVNGQIKFQSKGQIKQIFKEGGEVEAAYAAIPNRMAFTVEHGSQSGSQLTAAVDKFNIRTQGELVKLYGQGKLPDQIEEMDDAAAAELLEVLVTRVVLFDRRIYNRLVAPKSDKVDQQIKRLELYDKNLNLCIRDESIRQWKEMMAEGFVDDFHFVVVHLSFIEGVKDGEGNNYTEERIIDFIDDFVLMNRPAAEVGDNFKLVITTGRGRMKWWDTIQADPVYARFVTFRPIESMLGAVEDAMQMPDDVDLKYNLTKLLLGS